MQRRRTRNILLFGRSSISVPGNSECSHLAHESRVLPCTWSIAQCAIRSFINSDFEATRRRRRHFASGCANARKCSQVLVVPLFLSPLMFQRIASCDIKNHSRWKFRGVPAHTKVVFCSSFLVSVFVDLPQGLQIRRRAHGDAEGGRP
jgi:hypothetical protein